MRKIKCLIIDDESIARQGIEKYARQIDFLEVAGLCKNAIQANALLNQQETDLLFLDINMPQLSGMDFLKTLSKPPYVIFTTAYSEYALESFAFDVIDYLVKPISFERFLQSVNKANRMINKDFESGVDNYFYVKESQKLVKILVNEIVFIEAVQNYVNTTTTDKHMVLIPLKSILDLLPNNGVSGNNTKIIRNKTYIGY